MSNWKISPEGRQRCVEAGRARMAKLTPQQRTELASRFGNATLLRYSSDYFGSLGRKSAAARKPA